MQYSRRWWLLIGVSCLLLGIVAGSVAVADDEPLADAGLDQSVDQNATVLLDGTGSTPGTGEIESYNWSVQTPAGATFDPCDGSDCARSSFQAFQPGVYEVTLDIRDETGAVDTDTMYVRADSGRLFADLTGPEIADQGENTTLQAAYSPGSTPLDRIELYDDDELIATQSINGSAGVREFLVTQDAPVSNRYRIELVDNEANRTTDTHEVFTSRGDGDGPETSNVVGDHSIEIDGPRLFLDGDDQVGTYRFSGHVMPRLEHHWTEWKDDTGTVIGTGGSVTVEWEPGIHQLHALAHISDMDTRDTVGDDGWTAEDNSMSIVVDPSPRITVASLQTNPDRISGTIRATEKVGYLSSVEVSVDGETVNSQWIARQTSDRIPPVDGDQPDTLQLAFEKSDLQGDSATVDISATDHRGQTAVMTRTVSIPDSSVADRYRTQFNDARQVGPVADHDSQPFSGPTEPRHTTDIHDSSSQLSEASPVQPVSSHG